MYYYQKIVGSQRIKSIVFIIKNHYFVFKSIPYKQEGSESTSI